MASRTSWFLWPDRRGVPPQDDGHPGTERREALYELLLRLNTTELFHCAFGIEGNAIVLVSALELENMDFNEFQAVIDDIGMA
jgi:hypothetical protein